MTGVQTCALPISSVVSVDSMDIDIPKVKKRCLCRTDKEDSNESSGIIDISRNNIPINPYNLNTSVNNGLNSCPNYQPSQQSREMFNHSMMQQQIFMMQQQMLQQQTMMQQMMNSK